MTLTTSLLGQSHPLFRMAFALGQQLRSSPVPPPLIHTLLGGSMEAGIVVVKLESILMALTNLKQCYGLPRLCKERCWSTCQIALRSEAVPLHPTKQRVQKPEWGANKTHGSAAAAEC